MFNSRKERFTLSTLIVAVLLIGILLSPLIWTRAAGETTVNEDSLLLTDGSNPMMGNLNMSGYEIDFAVFDKGTSFPTSPTAGQPFYRTDWLILTVYNGTSWLNVTDSEGVTDHGELSGLSDDDHPQYLLADGSRVMAGDLNMSQNELQEAVIQASSSAPANPSEGQIYYDTDDNALYVYNGTAWDSPGGGEAGPAGPAGTVEGLPFSYMVFVNATSTYMLNGTTGAIDWNSADNDAVINAALSNMTNGGLLFIKTGTYEIQQALEIDYDNTHIKGENPEATTLKVIDQVSSILTTNANSGQKDVVVTSSTGFEVGQHVTIKDDSNQEKNEIASIAGNTLTMTSNLDHTYTTAANAFVATTFTLLQTTNAHSTTTSFYNVTIRDLTLDGNHANNVMYETSGDPYFQNVVTTRKSYGWTIDNVHFLNAPRNGIEIIGDKNKVSNSYFYNCNWNGLQFSGSYNEAVNCIAEEHGGGPAPVAFCNYGGSHNTFTNCIAINPETENAAFNSENGADYIQFIGCMAIGDTTFFSAGFSFSGSGIENKVVGCYAENCTYGVLTASTNTHTVAADSTFVNCYSPSSDYRSVIFIRGAYSIVSGNTIDCTDADHNVKGIRVSDGANFTVVDANGICNVRSDWSIYIADSNHCIISNNVCVDEKGTNRGNGITTYGTADYNIVLGNDASQTSTGYSFVGSNNEIDHNIGYP